MNIRSVFFCGNAFVPMRENAAVMYLTFPTFVILLGCHLWHCVGESPP